MRNSGMIEGNKYDPSDVNITGGSISNIDDPVDEHGVGDKGFNDGKYAQQGVNSDITSMTGLDDDGIPLAKVDVGTFIDGPLSPMILTGGVVSEGTNPGTFKVTALTALLRATDSATGALAEISLAEQDNQAISVADTTYIVILSYNGGSPTITISETIPNCTQNIPLGRVMKDASNNVYWISGGYHFQDGVAKLHMRARALRALELNKGSTIAYSGTNNFTMAEGKAFGGLNKFALASYDSATTTFVPIYQDGAGGWTEGAARNTIDFAHYDDESGTPAAIGNNRYGCHWVYRHVGDGSVYVRLGKGNYALADAETANEPTKPDHLTNFGCLIGKIIAPQAGGSFTTIQMDTDRHFTGTSV
ncbi:MAG: hypothetical protein U9O65_03905, partial [Thermotogota bacterium]|nr:hypothetical protein [Thermotogota bacterium]